MTSFALLPFAILLVVAVLLVAQTPALRGGAPYLPTHSVTVMRMVELGNIQQDEKVVDLGSGDGRIVIALAKAGAEAHGYEINPFLVLWSRYKIHRAGLSSKTTIHWKSFWNQDFGSFNVVAVFGFPRMMEPLETKLKNELKPGSRVISHLYQLPTWKHSKKEGSVYLYEKA